jgi:hypothetical protein
MRVCFPLKPKKINKYVIGLLFYVCSPLRCFIFYKKKQEETLLQVKYPRTKMLDFFDVKLCQNNYCKITNMDLVMKTPPSLLTSIPKPKTPTHITYS